jgi:hypothetical protein
LDLRTLASGGQIRRQVQIRLRAQAGSRQRFCERWRSAANRPDLRRAGARLLGREHGFDERFDDLALVGHERGHLQGAAMLQKPRPSDHAIAAVARNESGQRACGARRFDHAPAPADIPAEVTPPDAAFRLEKGARLDGPGVSPVVAEHSRCAHDR